MYEYDFQMLSFTGILPILCAYLTQRMDVYDFDTLFNGEMTDAVQWP